MRLLFGLALFLLGIGVGVGASRSLCPPPEEKLYDCPTYRNTPALRPPPEEKLYACPYCDQTPPPKSDHEPEVKDGNPWMNQKRRKAERERLSPK